MEDHLHYNTVFHDHGEEIGLVYENMCRVFAAGRYPDQEILQLASLCPNLLIAQNFINMARARAKYEVECSRAECAVVPSVSPYLTVIGFRTKNDGNGNARKILVPFYKGYRYAPYNPDSAPAFIKDAFKREWVFVPPTEFKHLKSYNIPLPEED
jgi:hypothetical protein